MVLRTAAAGALLVGGAYLIYGFGAGYFSSFGLALPTPLNLVATVLLATALVQACAYIVRPKRTRKTP